MSSLRLVVFVIVLHALLLAPRPVDLRGAEAEAPLTDCYGDPLPPGAVMRLGTTRFRDWHDCYSVAYSPDGKLLASGGSEGVVLWDAHSGKRRAFLESRLSADAVRLGKHWHRFVSRLAFSSDSRYLAVGCRGEAIVWELPTDKAYYLPGDGKESAMDLVGFTPDNRGVFTGDAREIRLRDWRTGKDLKRWEAPGSRSRQDKRALVEIVFGNKTLSADGKIIAADVYDAETRTSWLRVWDVDSGNDRRIEGGHGLLALSPDHSNLAVLDPRGEKLALVDVARGKVIRSWPIRWSIGKLVSSLDAAIAFSPDGKWLAAGDVVWSVATGKEICTLEDPCGRINGLCFSADGKTLTAAKGVWLDFWKLPKGNLVRDYPNHRGSVVDLAYSPDGRQLATAGSDDKTVRLWDTRTGKLIRCFGKTKPFLFSLAFSPDGQTLATEHGFSVVLWNIGDGRELREIPVDPRSAIRRIAISPDGKGLLAAQGRYIHEWDIASGEKLRLYGAGQTDIYAMALSPDGKVVAAACEDRIIRFWDRTIGKIVQELSPPRPCDRFTVKFALAFAPSGGLLAAVCGDGGTIDFAEVASARYQDKIIPYSKEGRGWGDRLWSIAFSTDGKTILCSANFSDTIKLIEVFSGKERIRFNIAGKVVLSPDGRTMASASQGGALIWDLTGRPQTGELRQDRLSNKELERLWADLASTDATVAHRAIWALIAGKEKSVSFLRRRIRVVRGLSAARMKELIDGLDSDSFQERERAARELAEQAEAVKPALLAVVANNQSLEQRLRATNLLAALPVPFLPASRLRLVRAIEVFEQLGGQESKRVLEALAEGAAGRLETEQARAALQRLRYRN